MAKVTFWMRTVSAGALVAVACGPSRETRLVGERSSAPEPVRAQAPGGSELLDELRKLGYVDWDPGADEGLRGVTRHDPDRAWPGSNLYVGGRNEVFLMDNLGRVQHSWRLPEDRERLVFAELLSDDTLAVVCNYRELTRLDLDSSLLWDLDLAAHHDVAERADGTLLVPFRRPEPWNGRKVRFDGIAFLSPEGQVASRWYAFEHLEELAAHHDPSRLDRMAEPGEPGGKKIPDYHHLNSVEILPDTPLGRSDARFRAGNLLVCFRNVNRILILDQDDFAVRWSWGAGELEGAHMPSMLPDGNILVFDNGVRRKSTRVIELEPVGERIVWCYQGDPPESFYSELRGSAQRLPNGNTLICEADRGHVIEVTSAGEVVWEFWNPELQDGMRQRIYRFMRHAPERVAPLLARVADRDRR